jgi:hypothetical protein
VCTVEVVTIVNPDVAENRALLYSSHVSRVEPLLPKPNLMVHGFNPSDIISIRK